MISIETTYGTTQSSLNCEVVLISMLEVYRVIQYFEVVPYRGDLVLHLDTVICMVHLCHLVVVPSVSITCVRVYACVHACTCVPHCECVSGWPTCTFACINMYYLDAGEAMATRFYNCLTAFGHHEVCTPSRKMYMHIPHLY